MLKHPLGKRVLIWGVLLLLALTPLGSLLGIAFVFGAALMAGAIASAVQQASAILGITIPGAPTSLPMALLTFLPFVVWVAFRLFRGLQAQWRGDDAIAIQNYGKAINIFGAVAFMALCIRTLQEAWP